MAECGQEGIKEGGGRGGGDYDEMEGWRWREGCLMMGGVLWEGTEREGLGV